MEARCIELFRDWARKHEVLWARREQLSDLLVHSLPESMTQSDVDEVIRRREEIESLQGTEREAWLAWQQCVRSRRLRRVS